MSEIFMFAVNAIAPLILLIGLGYLIKGLHVCDAAFFKTANRLVFRVFLPALLFYNTYEIEDLGAIDFGLVGYALAAIFLIFFLGMLTVSLFVKKPAQKGVILQCAFRSNFALIGIPLAESLGGSAALGNVAVLAAFSIPLFNVLAVIALSVFTEEKSAGIDWRKILKTICTNPLILSVAAGLAALLLREILPAGADGGLVFSLSGNLPFVYKTIENLAKVASPLALIVLGGQFNLQAVRGMLTMVLLGTVWRIVLAPLLALTGAVLLGTYTEFFRDTSHFPAYIALFGSPAAVSSAIMAGEMGGDDQLAGQLVVWTSLGSIVTVFLQVVLLRGMGMF